MLTIRKRRLYFIIFLIIGMSAAVGLSLYALRQNINLYLTPKQVIQQQIPVGQLFRLGGLVVKGSVHHQQNHLQIHFILTDYTKNMTVEYQGVLPSLFREGQGIVAEGKLNSKGIFIADQVLAKHDASYHPPEIKPIHAMKSNARIYR